MIEIYTGTPGSSKSLHAAHDIRISLNRPHPRPVIGNFQLAPDAPVKRRDLYTYIRNADLTAEFLQDYATSFWTAPDAPSFREEYILLVLDEVQLCFNSRLWQDKSRMSFLEFLSQHRKYGYHIILIAQSAKMVDNQFRQLIEYEVNHRRMSSMGVLGGIVGLIFGNRVFCRVTSLFQTGDRLSAEWCVGLRRDMDMYDSRKTFEQMQKA